MFKNKIKLRKQCLAKNKYSANEEEGVKSWFQLNHWELAEEQKKTELEK